MWNLSQWTTVAIVASAATWVSAQISAVEPYIAIVTTEATNMHSGDMRQYYVVAQLPARTAVRVDGEGGGFSRVSYPSGLTGFAAVRDVKDLGDGRVEVIRPTALKAFNMERGFGGSWQNLVPQGQELKPGETLKVIETITRSDGSVAAFVIVPPPSARGYIESSRLRRATAEERAAFLGETPRIAGDTSTREPMDRSPNATPGVVVITPPEEETTDPSPDPGSESTSAISLIDEIVTPGSEPAARTRTPEPAPAAQPAAQPGAVEGQTQVVTETQGVTEQVVGETAVVVPEDEPAAPQAIPQPDEPLEIVVTTPPRPADPTPTQPTTQPPGQTPVPTLPTTDTLEVLFDQVRRQPLMEAELDELASQFRRVRDSLSNSPVDRSLADRIDERLQVLDVMIDLRDRRRELADKRAALDVNRIESERRINEAYSRAGFTFVGQIVPSSIYDGVRLPKLYRVVSVDEAGTRTLAYVRDSERLGLSNKVGRVVGLDGSLSVDPTLGVRMLSATRSSVLRADGN